MTTRSRTDGKVGKVSAPGSASKIVRDSRTGRMQPAKGDPTVPAQADEVVYADSAEVQKIGKRVAARWAGLLDRLSE